MKFRPLLVLALALSSCPAQAEQVDDQARAAARTLAEDGVAALQNGDAATAADKLERAYEIVRLPTVGLWSARALAKEGRLVSASERYEKVIHWSGTTSEQRAQDQAKADATRERDELLPRIPSVKLVVEGATVGEVSITLDGTPVLAALIGTSQPADPKQHVLRGTRGTEVVEQAFDLAEGQHTTVTLKFGANAVAEPPAVTPAPVASQAPVALPPPAPPSQGDARADHGSFWNTQRTVAVAVGGAGVVAGIVSGVFTLSALSKKSDAGTYCHGSACTNEKGVDLLSDARGAGNVATITGIAGLVLVGAGVALFVTAPSAEGAQVAVTPAYLTGGGAVVATGAF